MDTNKPEHIKENCETQADKPTTSEEQEDKAENTYETVDDDGNADSDSSDDNECKYVCSTSTVILLKGTHTSSTDTDAPIPSIYRNRSDKEKSTNQKHVTFKGVFFVKDDLQNEEPEDKEYAEQIEDVKEYATQLEERHSMTVENVQEYSEQIEERKGMTVENVQEYAEQIEERKGMTVENVQEYAEQIEERNGMTVENVQEYTEQIEERNSKTIENVKECAVVIEKGSCKTVENIQEYAEQTEKKICQAVENVKEYVEKLEKQKYITLEKVKECAEEVERKMSKTVANVKAYKIEIDEKRVESGEDAQAQAKHIQSNDNDNETQHDVEEKKIELIKIFKTPTHVQIQIVEDAIENSNAHDNELKEENNICNVVETEQAHGEQDETIIEIETDDLENEQEKTVTSRFKQIMEMFENFTKSLKSFDMPELGEHPTRLTHQMQDMNAVSTAQSTPSHTDEDLSETECIELELPKLEKRSCCLCDIPNAVHICEDCAKQLENLSTTRNTKSTSTDSTASTSISCQTSFHLQTEYHPLKRSSSTSMPATNRHGLNELELQFLKLEAGSCNTSSTLNTVVQINSQRRLSQDSMLLKDPESATSIELLQIMHNRQCHQSTFHTIHIETTSSPSPSVMRRPPLARRMWAIITNIFSAICLCLQVNKDCLFCFGFFVIVIVCASFLTAFFYRTLTLNPAELQQQQHQAHVIEAKALQQSLDKNIYFY